MSDQIHPIPSYVRRLRTLADKGWQITIETQELDQELTAYLSSLIDSYGFTLFVKNAPKVEDINLPDFAPEFKRDKSPSERLRAVLYLLHKQQKLAEPFETFYKNKMEELIEHFKSKLEPK